MDEPEPRNERPLDEDCYREGRKDQPALSYNQLNDAVVNGLDYVEQAIAHEGRSQ